MFCIVWALLLYFYSYLFLILLFVDKLLNVTYFLRKILNLCTSQQICLLYNVYNVNVEILQEVVALLSRLVRWASPFLCFGGAAAPVVCCLPVAGCSRQPTDKVFGQAGNVHLNWLPLWNKGMNSSCVQVENVLLCMVYNFLHELYTIALSRKRLLFMNLLFIYIFSFFTYVYSSTEHWIYLQY